METVYLDGNQVPAFLREGYAGTKFKAVVTESVTIPSDAGLWAGGTRETFSAYRLDNGDAMALPGQDSAPWAGQRREYTAPLQPGLVIVRRSHFCGKDMGLTFYVHPSNAVAFLPGNEAESLPEREQTVLRLTAQLKSAYRRAEAKRAGIDAREYDAIVGKLQERGLLSANGGLTTKGKNEAQKLR